ncbi:MAG: VCBS repeat-containing protein [Actinomycetota bacterium]|nr:VCBS repeat-containing protein [Actinomycetota bacterium]
MLGGSALAATPATDYGALTVKPPGTGNSAYWGSRMAAAKHDYNGDGAGDVFVADQNNERVYLLSGKEAGAPSRETNPLRVLKDPLGQAYSGFGSFISVVGDASGDGKPDLAVGAPGASVTVNGVTENYAGTVFLMDPAKGKMLHRFDNPNPEYGTRYAQRIGSAGDLTGDNKPEVIVGASGWRPPGSYINVGKAYIFDGATGALHRTLDLPASDLAGCNCQFGLAVQGPGDIDGDGVTDQLVNAGYYGLGRRAQGRSYLFSGKTGELIRKIDSPEPESNPAFFGFQDAAPLTPGDVNDDGRADVYAASFEQDGPTGERQGKAWVFSGKDIASGPADVPFNTALYALDDPTPEKGGMFGWTMDKTDHNKDGTPDLYVGQAPHHGGLDGGGTYVMDGKDGSELKRLELPESCDQAASLGWSLAAPGDLNGDGEPDYLGGAPYFDIPQGEGQGPDGQGPPPFDWKPKNGMVLSFVSNPGPLPTPCSAEDLGG